MVKQLPVLSVMHAYRGEITGSWPAQISRTLSPSGRSRLSVTWADEPPWRDRGIAGRFEGIGTEGGLPGMGKNDPTPGLPVAAGLRGPVFRRGFELLSVPRPAADNPHERPDERTAAPTKREG